MLERGEVANSWRRERWDSLRLLTPNWQSRLPGYRYEGADPDGFMTMAEVVEFISRFAVVAAAPVRTHTTVTSVRRTDDGYHVATDQRRASGAGALVLASGACNLASVPALRAGRAGVDRNASRRSSTAIPSSCRTAACWSSAPRRPASSWPTRSTARAGP